MKSIEEPFFLLVFSVSLSGCIPSQGSELLEVLVHRHTPLLQLQELLSHDADQAGRYIALEKLAFEGFPGHHFILGKQCAGSFPPCTGRSSKVVGHIVGLLIVTHMGDPQVVLHGTDPVIHIKGLLTLENTDGLVFWKSLSLERPCYALFLGSFPSLGLTAI